MNAPGAVPMAERRRPIGELLREARQLSERQLQQIAAYQHKRSLRFGEAAVALRLVDRQDVLDALSQQFDYAGGFAGREGDSELVAAADPFSDQAEAFRRLRYLPVERFRIDASAVAVDDAVRQIVEALGG